MMNEPDLVSLCDDCPEPPPRPVVLPKGDGIRWTISAQVDRYDGDYTAEQIAAQQIRPVSSDVYDGNLLTNAGIQHILDQLTGATTDPLNNTNARLGVGNSATAASASQTDLQAAAGSANRQFKLMDATYPSRSSNIVTWKATYSAAEALFTWNEWCIDNGSSNGTTVVAPMINRKVASMGTKGAVTWTLTVTLTLT